MSLFRLLKIWEVNASSGLTLFIYRDINLRIKFTFLVFLKNKPGIPGQNEHAKLMIPSPTN